MKSRTPTIKDVAQLAGVSVTTVSHVINGTRYVSEELRTRVENAVEHLGYHPNFVGRTLRKGRSYSIALLLSNLANPFFPQVARGIKDKAFEQGYSVVFCGTDEDPQEEAMYLDLLSSKRMDGLIVVPTQQWKGNLLPLVERGLPLVVIDRRVDLPVDQVYSNNVQGAYQATGYLIELGHRRIGIILGVLEITSITDRLAGYREALQDHRIKVDEGLIAEGGLQVQDGYKAAERLLKNGVSAIFSTNNLMTLGLLHCLRDQNIKCPQEVSVVGFDDADWATTFSPRLTVVAQQPYEMGRWAVQLLFERIHGQRKEPRKIILDTHLIVRESTVGTNIRE
jgi:LacI family transcriptional regulator